MDYLNSLDIDRTNRRSHRVRSWYLYEQYKALERNQLDAAKRLKDKSYQEKILHQELFERKARRKLCNELESWAICQREPSRDRSMKNDCNKIALSVSADDFFESFCELHGDETITENDFSDETLSQDDSILLKSVTDEFKSFEDPKDENSYSESIKSVIENIKSTENLEKMLVNENIAKNLNLQLEEAKENIECIEKNIELNDTDKGSEDESGFSLLEYKTKQIGIATRKSKNQNNSIFAMWSRLVSFAYQIITMNHGNCYYDYSSQFLTAVLACDVLRRGISRMCNILQPYVSPIKFVTDDESDFTADLHKNVKRKFIRIKKCRKGLLAKEIPSRKAEVSRKHRIAQKHCSENCWQRHSKGSMKKYANKRNNKWFSEPWRSTPKFTLENDDVSDHSSSCGSIWPDFSKENICKTNHMCDYSCCKRFRKPMMKIAHCINSILKDLDECY